MIALLKLSSKGSDISRSDILNKLAASSGSGWIYEEHQVTTTSNDLMLFAEISMLFKSKLYFLVFSLKVFNDFFSKLCF